MKRTIALITALTMVFMTACSGSTESDSSKAASHSGQNDTSSVSETTTTASQTTTATTTASSETAASSSAQSTDSTSSHTGTVTQKQRDDSRLTARSTGYDPDLMLEEMKKYLNEVLEQSGKSTADTDKDGIPDVIEQSYGTDPNKADTDGDGLDDLVEYVLTRTDPTKPASNSDGVSDAKADTDKDGLSNEKELAMKLMPFEPDTDSDELNDGDEVNKYHTDPKNKDTDGDTLSDGEEAEIGTDPLSPVTNGIADNQHYIKQTIPEDAPHLMMLNKYSDSPYKVSFEYEAIGSVKHHISAGTSRHVVITEYMKDVVVGEGVDVSKLGKTECRNGVIKFRIDKDYINKELKGKSLPNKPDGIRRLVIYAVPRYAGLEPVKTEYDEKNGIVYAQMNDRTQFALVDEYLYAEHLTKSLEEYEKLTKQQ